MSIQFLQKLNLNKLLVITGTIVFVLIIVFIVWWNNEISINNGITITDRDEVSKSLITGLDCPDVNNRPIAIMLASDKDTRPLSGISHADIVFEMPVAPNGFSRFMAVFQCEKPSEIGSVRSARNDFIPLAAGFNSIFVHWGGEQGALEKLDAHIIDNVDAMKYEGTVFYRKKDVPLPHNGFTKTGSLIEISRALNYELDNSFAGYPHQQQLPVKNLNNIVDQITVDYPSAFYNNLVVWKYNQGNNTYSRSRGGEPELDRNNGTQVKAGAVIVMETTASLLTGQYINVNVVGEGNAKIYQNGIRIDGKWKKESLGGKLYFYDTKRQEIQFANGQIWVEVQAINLLNSR